MVVIIIVVVVVVALIVVIVGSGGGNRNSCISGGMNCVRHVSVLLLNEFTTPQNSTAR